MADALKNDKIFVVKQRLNEAKKLNIVDNFPVNQIFKYDQAKMIQAIQNGMILLLVYKGDEDDRDKGGERIICPLVLGINKNTKNVLIRGFHLDGFSVHVKRNTKKVWRLFKASNIISMTFTGNFIQMSPQGYKMNDRVMTETTICRADFSQIRRNQNMLKQKGLIELEEEAEVSKKLGVAKINIEYSGEDIDLKTPLSNPIIKKEKDRFDELKFSVLKTIMGNDMIVVAGAQGNVGRTVDPYEYNKLKGHYKVVDSFTGKELKERTNKSVKGQNVFQMYVFKGQRK